MLKEHQSLLSRLLVLIDLALIVTGFFLGYFIRNHHLVLSHINEIPKTYPLHTYFSLIPYWVSIWLLTLLTAGAYRPFRAQHSLSLLTAIFRAAVFSTLLFGSFAYLMKIQYVSRSLISIICFLTWFLISIERLVVQAVVRDLFKRGINTRFLLIVGTGSRALAFIKMLSQNPEWGLKVAGLVDDDETRIGSVHEGHTVLGTLRDIPLLLENIVVDEVIYIVPRGWLGKIEDSVLYCEQLGKRVSIAVDLFNVRFAKAVQRDIQHFPFLTFETTSNLLWQLFIKRFLDIVLAAISIVVLFPLLIFVAALIKLTSGGPILFKQTRCGLSGRLFTVYKFRTMVIDAEQRLETLRKQNEMTGPAFKMANDPRVIKHGKWLRKFSIDELPQLFNILEGNMSFVGPRPPIPAEVKKYEPWQRRRLSLRPGLTCIWQVQGRNKIVRFEEWMKLDLEYIDNWSLWLDLKLFIKTIPIALLGIGAK